jgi:hypothetical protein
MTGGYICSKFPQFPIGQTFGTLTIKAQIRISHSGPNNWIGSPAFAPVIITGAGTYIGSYTSIPNSESFKRATTPPWKPGWGRQYTVGVFPNDPNDAAAWDYVKLAKGTFQAGIAANLAGLVPGMIRNHVLDVQQLWVEIESTSTKTLTEPVRAQSSRTLRTFDSPVQGARIVVPHNYSDVDPGDTIYLKDNKWVPSYDGEGSGIDPVDFKPLLVTGVKESLSRREVEIQTLDMNAKGVTFWAPFRTTIGSTDSFDGHAEINQGDAMLTDRANSGNILRPNDLRLTQIGSNERVLTPFGLRCGGDYRSAYIGPPVGGSSLGDYWHSGYNDFSATGGGGWNGTGWTWVAGAGSPSIGWSPDDWYDISGKTGRGIRITMDGSNVSFINRAASSPGVNEFARMHVVFKIDPNVNDPNTATPTGPVWVLADYTRGGGAYYWNPGTGWSASGGWHYMNNGVGGATGRGITHIHKIGDFWHYWTDSFPGVGRPLTPHVGPHLDLKSGYLDFYLCEIVRYGAVGTNSWYQIYPRDSFNLNATGADLRYYGEDNSIPNGGAYPIADADHGFMSFVFTPMWSHEDLANGEYKFIMSNLFDPSGDVDQIAYIRIDASSAQVIFRRHTGTVNRMTAIFTATGSNLAQRYVPMKFAARWTGENGELGAATTSPMLDVFINGVKGASGTAAFFPTRQSDSSIQIGHYQAPGWYESTPVRHADGYFADLEFRATVPNDNEVAFIHNTIGKNMQAVVAA